MDQQLDITAPKLGVDITVREDGKVIWVNVDGVNVLRVCQIPTLLVRIQAPHLFPFLFEYKNGQMNMEHGNRSSS